MRWQLYLDQSAGLGNVALAIGVSMLGLFAWWLLIEKTSLLDRWRPQLNTGFWSVITIIFLLFFLWLCFLWPG